MDITFWGVRGSIPTPLNNEHLNLKFFKLLYLYNKSEYYKKKDIAGFLKETPFHIQGTYGGNTACIEINCGDELLILDAGSGIRALGLDILKRDKPHDVIHLFISHTHWDHINGFPFFTPAFIKGKTIKIYSPLKDIEERIDYQQDFRFFPLGLEHMASTIEFIPLEENTPFTINGITINNFKQNHPGDSYAFSIEHQDKKIVYSSDNEILNSDENFILAYEKFIRNADVLVFDAQYTLQETVEKITWGHSSDTMGIELSLRSNIKNLVFFHYEPRNSDEVIYHNLRTTEQFYKLVKPNFEKKHPEDLNIIASYEGLNLEI